MPACKDHGTITAVVLPRGADPCRKGMGTCGGAPNGRRARSRVPWCKIAKTTEFSQLGTISSSPVLNIWARYGTPVPSGQRPPRTLSRPAGGARAKRGLAPRGKKTSPWGMPETNEIYHSSALSAPAEILSPEQTTSARPTGLQAQPRDPCRAPPERHFAREADRAQPSPFEHIASRLFCLSAQVGIEVVAKIEIICTALTTDRK